MIVLDKCNNCYIYNVIIENFISPVHVYASLRGLIVVWIGSRWFVCDSLDLKLTS